MGRRALRITPTIIIRGTCRKGKRACEKQRAAPPCGIAIDGAERSDAEKTQARRRDEPNGAPVFANSTAAWRQCVSP
jgi:hypothetical protein